MKAARSNVLVECKERSCVYCKVRSSEFVERFVSPRGQQCGSKKSKNCGMQWLGAVEVVAGNDVWTARLIFVGGTINRIVTALDAGAGTGRFNELDVVIVSKAGASLWVTLASGATTGIVLATSVLGVQTTEVARPDATGKLSKTFSVLALPALESNAGPEVRGQLTLLWRVPTIRRTIGLSLSLRGARNHRCWCVHHEA